jgi:1-acyl-sn-glycerol-3-phosphate acyltransferase
MLSAQGIDILSWGVLIAAALSPALLLLRWVLTHRLTPLQHFFSLLNVVYTRVIWRGNVFGRLKLPYGQGAVIACNHKSSVDTCFLALIAKRMVHWMVAGEYFSHPAFGWFLKAAGCIPTRRGGIDTKSTREAIRLAQSGGLLGVFPEGRINNTPEVMRPGRAGVALIALKARVPVVPCYIEGSPFNGTIHGPLFMRAKVTLRVGRPIDLSAWFGRENEKAVLEEVTLRILKEIALLAGRDDYEPQLAGKTKRQETVPHEGNTNLNLR